MRGKKDSTTFYDSNNFRVIFATGATKAGKNGDNLCWTVGAGLILATAFLLPASIGIK